MEKITVRLTPGTEGAIYLGKTLVGPALRRLNQRTLEPLPLKGGNPWVTVPLKPEERVVITGKVRFYQDAGKIEVKGESVRVVGGALEIDDLSEVPWPKLRKMASELGINGHGMKREEIEQRIKELREDGRG